MFLIWAHPSWTRGRRNMWSLRSLPLYQVGHSADIMKDRCQGWLPPKSSDFYWWHKTQSDTFPHGWFRWPWTRFSPSGEKRCCQTSFWKNKFLSYSNLLFFRLQFIDSLIYPLFIHHLPIHPSVCPSIIHPNYPSSIRLPIHPSSIQPPVCPSIHPPIKHRSFHPFFFSVF